MKRLTALLFLLLAVGTSYGQTTSSIGNFPFNLQALPSPSPSPADRIMVWDNTDTNVLGGTGGITYATLGAGLAYTHSTHTLSATGGGGGMSNPMTTAGDIIYGGSAGAPLRLGIGTSGQVLSVVSGAPAWGAISVADSSVSFTDITTGNVSSSQHGFAPKSPGLANTWLNGGSTPSFTAIFYDQLSGSEVNFNAVIADTPSGTGDINDYAPTGLSGTQTVKVNGGSNNRNLTGLTAPSVDGRIITIINAGTTNNLVLRSQNTGSIAANRFLLPSDITLAPNDAVTLRYDTNGTVNKWRAFGGWSNTAPILQDNNAPSSPVTPDVDNYTDITYRGITAALTFNAPTGTPPSGRKLLMRIKDNGSTQTLTFTGGTNGFRFGTDITATPSGGNYTIATSPGKSLYLGFRWTSTDARWDCIAKADGY